MRSDKIIIIGAGLAGLSAAIALSAKGKEVLLFEKESAVGGKMRQQNTNARPIDAGPTVLTMKWVFDQLFDMAGTSIDAQIGLQRADILARHAWSGDGHFDLHGAQDASEAEIRSFFGPANAAGYRKFCSDSAAVFNTLKDTYIAAPCPSPTQLASRVGFLNAPKLLALKPLHTLWRSLETYFPDQRLRQLFGRYATYVGSSPYLAPATLMLIAHVEQEGVWFVKDGIHKLAAAMAKVAQAQGASLRLYADIETIVTDHKGVTGITLGDGEMIESAHILYCGDVSRLSPPFITSRAAAAQKVPPSKRSLSAITWTADIKTSGFDLKRHNVFFSPDYRREFRELFSANQPPSDPTVYICAQDRETDAPHEDGTPERLLCLINAPAFGDKRRLDEEEMSQCFDATQSRLKACGLTLDAPLTRMQATQPADFNQLFPGSGGALYGRASHGWTASFARPGTKTRIPGLYLAGGSVHPGAGVPMATLSGMLAAEQIIKDHALI